jgi:two-component system response regulator GlrR
MSQRELRANNTCDRRPEVHLIGQSPLFLEVLRMVRRIAATDATALIEGETGTGKELVARAIHYQGARRDLPFIPVNCGALPESLVENELFGHKRGAFTDASVDCPGLLQLADRGTLFLDEVDTLPPKGQVVLLRFLQDHSYRPLGARAERHSDVRVIAATNRPLDKAVRAGDFRADLYYRLNLARVVLPPLRARQGDVDLLAQHFLRECALRYGAPERRVDPQTLNWFRSYDWPGNVRELENLIHREFLLSDGSEIRIASREEPPVRLPEATSPTAGEGGAFPIYMTARARTLAEFDRVYLTQVLTRARGNVTLAAKIAGKERRALGKLIKRYCILPRSFRR